MSALVMINGCFDGLHPGHVRLLEFAAGFGRLCVAINSDESVRRLKGTGRPLFAAVDREFMLRATRYVSDVYVFHEDTPATAIRSINPDMIVVGYDHSIDDPHYRAAAGQGKLVMQAPRFNDYSTTEILRRLQAW